MYKIVWLTLFTFSVHSSFFIKKESGDGLGNGGIAVECQVQSPYQNKVSILLDIFENITLHHKKNYYSEIFDSTTSLAKEVFMNSEMAGENNYFRKLLNKLIMLDDPKLAKIFSHHQIEQLKRAKKDIIENFWITFIPGRTVYLNITQDTGNIRFPDENTLHSFKLSNCQLFQGAMLIVDSSSKHLSFLTESLKKMDNLSFIALLWHEVIYYSMKDEVSSQNSIKTRMLTSKLMQLIFPLNEEL